MRSENGQFPLGMMKANAPVGTLPVRKLARTPCPGLSKAVWRITAWWSPFWGTPSISKRQFFCSSSPAASMLWTPVDHICLGRGFGHCHSGHYALRGLFSQSRCLDACQPLSPKSGQAWGVPGHREICSEEQSFVTSQHWPQVLACCFLVTVSPQIWLYDWILQTAGGRKVGEKCSSTLLSLPNPVFLFLWELGSAITRLKSQNRLHFRKLARD